MESHVKNILAAIDLSPMSDIILQKALQIASCFSAKVWIIHVADPEPAFMGFDEGPGHERTWKAEKLHSEHQIIQQKANELAHQNIDVTALLLQGSTVDTIHRQAEKLDADLIIMGMHSHGILEKALLGNITAGVIKTISRPVLLVPAPSD